MSGTKKEAQRVLGEMLQDHVSLDQGSLDQGQDSLDQRQGSLDQRQSSPDQGQDSPDRGQDSLYQGQGAPDQGPCYTHDLTVEQFLDEWMETKAMTLSSTTLAWYRYVIARHIAPELGRLRMSQLRPVHVQRLYASKLQQVPGGPKPISRSTARCIHRVLHAALSSAVRLQVIERNPCDAVEVPTGGRPRPRYWRPEEAARFLNAARNDRLFALFHLALGTGLRRGELLGLRWTDVDLDRQSLTVSQVRVRAGSEIVTKEPKTPGSHRSIALSPAVCDTLRRHKEVQSRESALMQEAYEDHGLVFAAIDGRPLNPDYIGCQYFRRLISLARVPEINFHGLRHTHATLLALGGVPLKTVSARLGHSSVKITGDIYSHVLDRMDRGAALQFDAILSKAFDASPGELE